MFQLQLIFLNASKGTKSHLGDEKFLRWFYPIARCQFILQDVIVFITVAQNEPTRCSNVFIQILLLLIRV